MRKKCQEFQEAGRKITKDYYGFPKAEINKNSVENSDDDKVSSVFFSFLFSILTTLQFIQKTKITVLDTTISSPPPNSNDLNPCENFLKYRKFPGKIIFTGQKCGWSFARKETLLELKWGRPLRKTSFEFGGGVK